MCFLTNRLPFLLGVLFSMCWSFEAQSADQPVYRWKNVAIGGGGYVTGLVIHPKEKGLVYIRTDIGGCYRWNEKDMQWIPITDHFDQSGYYGGESIALDPNDPTVVYLAAGQSFRPGSIFKSKDRGETWTNLNLNDVPMHGNGDLRWAGERLAVNPFDSKVIMFGSRTRGLFRSTNGGISWESAGFIGNPTKDIGILSVLFDPASKGKVYINVYGDGIYESMDGGNTWGRSAGSPSGVLRISMGNDGTLYTAGRTAPKVAKKKKDGTWEDITPVKFRPAGSAPTSTMMVLESLNFCGISVDLNNSNHIVLSFDYKMPGKIFSSLDGGASWIEVKKKLNKTVPWWQDNYWGGAMAALVIDPHVPGQVWFTDWFGVWRTENISDEVPTWTILGAGHEEIVSTCLIAPPAASSSSGYMLMSGAMDICGLIHYDLDIFPKSKLIPTYQHTWDLDYCAGNPSFIVRVGENAAMNFLGDYNVSTESNRFGGATSSDEGRTWKNFGSMPAVDVGATSVAMSATNPDVMVMICQDSAFRTQDGGNSWHKITTPPGEGRRRRQSLASDRVNGQKFYSYNNGKLYRSLDGGVTFAPTTASLPSGNGIVKTVQGMEGEVWVGLGANGLYRSSNSGSSFSRIETVENALLFSFGKPLNGMTSPIVYVLGTVNGKKGVYRSLDFGKTWQDITPKNEAVLSASPGVMEASKQNPGLVFIGTNGRGIFYGVPDDFSTAR